MKNTIHEHIQFVPITKGLGFHPFATGLPYAPNQKSVPKPKRVKAVMPPAPPRIQPQDPSRRIWAFCIDCIGFFACWWVHGILAFCFLGFQEVLFRTTLGQKLMGISLRGSRIRIAARFCLWVLCPMASCALLFGKKPFYERVLHDIE